eukprot:8727552-Karenia_brevis.AAC.1
MNVGLRFLEEHAADGHGDLKAVIIFDSAYAASMTLGHALPHAGVNEKPVYATRRLYRRLSQQMDLSLFKVPGHA